MQPGAVVVEQRRHSIRLRRMAGYLEHVRSNYKSRTEWFDLDLPWAKRDAMEVTVIAK